jgi:hypothetical protein
MFVGEDLRISSGVKLNVYDLSPNNNSTWTFGLGGVFRSGVEIAGTEYSYSANRGVFSSKPREFASSSMPLRESRDMGEFTGNVSMVFATVEFLKKRFRQDNYDILNHNSNSFCHILLRYLVRQGTPLYLNRLMFLASLVRICLPPTDELCFDAIRLEAHDNQIMEGSCIGDTTSATGKGKQLNKMKEKEYYNGKDKLEERQKVQMTPLEIRKAEAARYQSNIQNIASEKKCSWRCIFKSCTGFSCVAKITTPDDVQRY